MPLRFISIYHLDFGGARFFCIGKSAMETVLFEFLRGMCSAKTTL